MIASSVITDEKIRWAVNGFRSLQQGIETLVVPLCKILTACLAFGFVPKAWQKVRVVFIPRPGHSSYELENSFRPISLTSFLLKTMERLVDRHIKEGPLKESRLSPMQDHCLPRCQGSF
jgi:hypothetical protein